MVTFFSLMLLSLTALAADEIQFSCYPLNPPRVQGEEKFLKLKFSSDGSVSTKFYGMSGDVIDFSAIATMESSHYSHDASTASATWKKDGSPFVQLSMAYFGSWWGAILRTYVDISLGSESVASDSELEFRCQEAP